MTRRIRSDATELVQVHPRDEFGHVIGPALWLAAGDEVPDGATVGDEHLEREGAAPVPPSSPSGGGVGAGEGAALPPFDPAELSVDEVHDRLEGLPDDQVRVVLAAESANRKRTGITNGPAARRLH